MEELLAEYKADRQKNEKTEKQAERWVEMPEITKVLHQKYKDLREDNIMGKETLTKSEFKKLQSFVIASLYMLDPENHPPVRLDYNMKVISKRDYDKLSEKELKENYLVVQSRTKKFFSFGQYKTDKKFGLKVIPVSKTINSLLNVWLKHNKSEYLLLNTRGGRMNPDGLSKAVRAFFRKEMGKELGVSMLRSIYLSHKFPADEIDERKRVGDAMLHSIGTQAEYVKRD